MENQQTHFFKYCVVPMCKNNIKTAPNKAYFHMPRNEAVRKKWCKAMKKENTVSSATSFYCCEDHFDIEEDTENFMQYKIMTLQQGKKVTLKLKKGIVPYKFQCQTQMELCMPSIGEDIVKLNRQDDEACPCKSDPGKKALLSQAGTSTTSVPYDLNKLNSSYLLSNPQTKIYKSDKAVQVNFKVHYRSKGVNVNLLDKKI